MEDIHVAVIKASLPMKTSVMVCIYEAFYLCSSCLLKMFFGTNNMVHRSKEQSDQVHIVCFHKKV